MMDRADDVRDLELADPRCRADGRRDVRAGRLYVVARACSLDRRIAVIRHRVVMADAGHRVRGTRRLRWCRCGGTSRGVTRGRPTQPFLNRRTEGLVGRVFTLEKPIIDGVGTVRMDDTIWRVAGPDAPSGSRVKVIRADGASLTVELGKRDPKRRLHGGYRADARCRPALAFGDDQRGDL